MTLLRIITDGTRPNTEVVEAVDGKPVQMLHVRTWIFEDGTEGIVFEIELPAENTPSESPEQDS